MMETVTPAKRVLLAIRRIVSIAVSRIRRLTGSLFGLVLNDQLGDLSRQTQRLGSASVESVTYVGTELRALDERLKAIEHELAALRGLIESQGAGDGDSLERPDEVASGPHSG
jgi:hypothetical protein